MKKLTALLLTLPFITGCISALNSYADEEYGKCIDVSEFQGEIDWNAVRNNGVEYAVIRCGYTNLSNTEYGVDDYFFANYEGAKNAGIKVGTYLYTVAPTISEMESNVNDMLNTISGLEFDLPVYLDIESEKMQGGLSKRELTDILAYGCGLIEESGYKAGIYANKNWMNNHFYCYELRDKGFDLWGAAYPYASSVADPYDFDFSEFDIWQYSNHGTVDGILGEVDVDFIYRIDEHDTQQYAPVQIEEGIYSFRSIANNNYMNYYYGVSYIGPVNTMIPDGSPEQTFYVKSEGDYKYSIQILHNEGGVVNSLTTNEVKKGTKISRYDAVEDDTELFYFYQTGDNYIISSAQNRQLAFTVPDEKDGQLYYDTFSTDNLSQQWELILIEPHYIITEDKEDDNVIPGDANCDGTVNMSDAVLIMQSLANPSKYGVNGTDSNHITEHGIKNGDMNGDGLTNSDALDIQLMILGVK